MVPSFKKAMEMAREARAAEERRVLSGGEKRELQTAVAGRRLERFVRIILGTGIRPGEGCAVRWADFDFTEKLLTVRRGGGEGNSSTKSRKSRRVPIPRDLEEFLLDLPNDGGLVVGMKLDTVEKWFRRHRSYSPHSLRHTYAADYLRRGGRIEILRKILGHASLATTDIYVHLAGSDLREGIDALAALPAPEVTVSLVTPDVTPKINRVLESIEQVSQVAD